MQDILQDGGRLLPGADAPKDGDGLVFVLPCKRIEHAFQAVVGLEQLVGSSLDRLPMAFVRTRHVDALDFAPAAFAAHGLAIALLQRLGWPVEGRGRREAAL